MRLGFIGLGNMGEHMSLNLIKAGHQVVVHDVRPEAAKRHLEAGAVCANSPEEVARRSDVVFTSLPTPAIVEEVALGENGIIHGVKAGDVYVDTSTNSPKVVVAIARAFAEKGVQMLDAPVSGGPTGARDGTLAVMVGGDEATYERCADLFRVLGKTVVHMGEIGSGTQTKLINNMVGASTMHVVGECLVLAKKLGLDLKRVHEVLTGGAADSFVLRQRFPRSWFVGNFEPGFALDWAYKDVNLGTQMAREAGVPMRIANLVQEAMIQARARGFGRKDTTSFLIPIEEAVDVEVRVDVKSQRQE